ncbi:MAG: OmpH/Skp family outer membrane protein [Planctomycetota bacterium]
MNKISFKMRILTISLFVLVSMLTFKTMPQEVFAQELKIGVVDINKIFDKFEKRKDLDQQLKDMEVEYKDEIESKKKAMIDLSEETQLLDLGSEKRNKNMETLERKNVELEGYAKLAEKQLTKRYKDAFEKIYEEITKEVDAFGKENNYSLIIKKEDSDLQTNQISDLQFKIGIRTVLYNSNRVDVTANITDRLNARYKKGKE